MTVAALILAAGRSTRFGADNKLLAMLEGRPLLQHVIEAVSQAGFAPPLVVTGHEAEAVAAIAKANGAGVIHNSGYAEGLSTSLKVGIAALPAACEAALVLLGDMPRVKPDTLKALRDAAQANPQAMAVIPAFRGEWGNPVLLRSALFPAVMALTGDQGARKLLAARSDCVVVAVDDPGILADIDTRDALNNAEAM